MSVAGTVVIAAGGTGGHIYPAIAVARVLESRKVPVVWIGTREGLEAQIVPKANLDIRFINISGFRGKGLKGLVFGPFKLIAACMQSVRILSEVGAKSVLGMGGFVSGPVGIAALMTRRSLVLHEQNAVAGMTNKWLGGFASRVFSAMPNVFANKVKAQAIGNPVRDSIEAIGVARKPEVLEARSELRILVIGGSRGARILNEVVPAGVQALLKASEQLDVHVWHQTGPADEQSVTQSYSDANTQAASVTVSAFVDDISAAYEWADVIVCRSGAMTVSELSAAALPGILVPFPHHADNHQTKNAKFLSDSGAAVLLAQENLNEETLSSTLLSMVETPDALQKMSQAAKGLHQPNAAKVVADALLEVGE